MVDKRMTVLTKTLNITGVTLHSNIAMDITNTKIDDISAIVYVSDECLETSPCKHDCIVKIKDVYKIRLLSSDKIKNLIDDNTELNGHFRDYIDISKKDISKKENKKKDILFHFG